MAPVVCAPAADPPRPPAYVFTAAPRYEPRAWAEGGEPFPAGAVLTYVSGAVRRPVAPGFFASAGAAVGFDGRRVLFAGKRAAADRWSIWEAALEGGAPRAVSSGGGDCVRPLYLPDGRAAWSRRTGREAFIEVAPLAGGAPARLTFAPGNFLLADVLRDGRILFEAGLLPGARDLWTVYPDGTGVESLRCDHGPDRSGARQLASGDVVFTAAGRLARFTTALAVQVDIAQPAGAPAGPVAEIAPGRWIVALRAKPSAPFALFLWDAAAGRLAPLDAPAGINAVEPAAAAPRTPPHEFPSALVATRTTGNLLCLDARESKTPLAAEPRSVRLWTREAGGEAVALGEAPVERDGSFYVEVPADRPLRLEVLDASGRAVRPMRSWFWMRPSEQRVCVGCHAGPERSPENKVPDVLLKSTRPVSLLETHGARHESQN